ncbi:unnamed protein product [Leptosia nina]|uniref:Cytochrome P450 n=1 Tax=Leptosia nina TaxID=320188 RepID=A0AAV1JBC1_9NEOP
MIFLILLTVVVGLWISLYKYKRRRVYELAYRIPTPPDVPSNFGVTKYTLEGIKVFLPLLRKYSFYAFEKNGIVRVMTDPYVYVVMTHREDVEYILKNCLHKDDLMDFFGEIFGGAGIFTSVSKWTRRRKLLVPAFGPKVLKSFVDIQSKQGSRLAEQLEIDGCVGSKEFSVWPYITAYTLGSVAETSLGVKIDALKNPDLPFLKAVGAAFSLVSERILHMWLWPDCLYKYSDLHARFQTVKKTLFSLPEEIIKEKRKTAWKKMENGNSNENNTLFGSDADMSFLDHLMLLSAEGNGLNDTELREEIMVMLLAGTDSSAVAIGYTLVLLSKYPEEQEKIYKELYSVFGDSDRRLTQADLLQLNYLNMFIKESLRLFPPVPVVARRTGNEEVTLPSGVVLPIDTKCIISLWGMNRDPKVWGPDADCFRPDRFLDKNLLHYASFSLGPRNCLGYQYALQSVKIAIASMVRLYKIMGEVEKGPVPHIDSEYSIMMRAADDFKISLERR